MDSLGFTFQRVYSSSLALLGDANGWSVFCWECLLSVSDQTHAEKGVPINCQLGNERKKGEGNKRNIVLQSCSMKDVC